MRVVITVDHSTFANWKDKLDLYFIYFDCNSLSDKEIYTVYNCPENLTAFNIILITIITVIFSEEYTFKSSSVYL